MLLREAPPTSRVPAEEKQEHPLVLPGTPPAQGPVPAGGIHEPQRWHPCPQSLAGTAQGQDGSRQANRGAVPCPLLVSHLLWAPCFHVPLFMAPLGKTLEVGADFSAHFCVVQLVMIRGGGAAGGGVPEDGLWMLSESFSSRMAVLGLDRFCVSSWSCAAEALQGYGTARQTKLLEGWEGCGCAKPDGCHVLTSGCPTSLYSAEPWLGSLLCKSLQLKKTLGRRRQRRPCLQVLTGF